MFMEKFCNSFLIGSFFNVLTMSGVISLFSE